MSEFFADSALLKPVDAETMKRIQDHLRSESETELIKANIRNVLFCGASRSGKTTCFKVIEDPCHCPDKSSMFSETQNTVFKSFSLKNNKDGSVLDYILNMIDTPGTFEIRAADEDFEKRSNDKISELIVDCLNHQVTYLNMVVLFLTVGGSVSSRDVDSIELFMKMFGGSGIPVILCITHADEHNLAQRDNITDEIKRYPRLAQYFKTTPENPSPQLEILFMGCVDYIHKDYHDPQVVAKLYSDVESWRNTFLQRIFVADEQIQLKRTNIYNTHKTKMSELLYNCFLELNLLSKADPETSEYKKRLEENRVNMEILFKNKMILEHDDSLVKQDVVKFWELIQNLKKEARGSEQKVKNIRSELIYPWSIE